MELKEFVEATLCQLMDGVVAAQSYAKKKGARVNPSGITFSTNQPIQKMWLADNDGAIVQEVDFDVVVTATEGKTTKGGVGVFMAGVGLGSQGQSERNSESQSRVKFSVPLVFPLQGAETE